MAAMARHRRAVAVACIALVVVAAVLPLGGMSIDCIVVPTAFLLLPALSPADALVELPACASPRAVFLDAIDFRGPPVRPLA
jgi:hypothetical protein